MHKKGELQENSQKNNPKQFWLKGASTTNSITIQKPSMMQRRLF